jgi:tRNA nucleotidyltransferase (CCA-adding enzyme)
MIVQINKIAADNPRLSKMINLYLDTLRYIRPQLTGKDLIALGVPAGPQVGRILNSLYIARINGDVSSRAEEIEMVDRIMEQ